MKAGAPHPAPRDRLRAAALLALVLILAGCGGDASLRAEPQHALMDTPLHITVTGMRLPVVIHASTVDRNGVRYTSTLTGRTHSLDGGPLLWSLKPADTSKPYVLVPAQFTESVTVTAGKLRTTVTRDLVARDVTVREVPHGALFLPRHPSTVGVLAFGGSEGGLSMREEAALLADHGFTTLALAYFDAPGLPHDLHDIPIEYFGRALHTLAQQRGVKKLVVYGVSRGSEAAQLTAIHYPRLVNGVVALVPANGSRCGIPPYDGVHLVSCEGAAWTWGGKPVPWDYPSPSLKPFPDEKINGPVFLVCGVLDQLWPSCPMAEAIRDRAKDVTLLECERCGHWIGALPPYLAGGGRSDGSFPGANQRARAAYWPKLLAWLDRIAT